MPRTGRRPKLLDTVAIQVPDENGNPVVTRVPIGEAIAQRIAIGCTYEAAAGSIGISESSLFEWQKKGREDLAQGRESIYSEFLERMTRAREESEVALVADIRAASKDRPAQNGLPFRPGDWRAALAILERRFPKRWGRVDRVELTGRDGEPVLSPEIATKVIDEAHRRIHEGERREAREVQ